MGTLTSPHDVSGFDQHSVLSVIVLFFFITNVNGSRLRKILRNSKPK